MAFILIAASLFVVTDLFLLGGYKYLQAGRADAQTVGQTPEGVNMTLESEALDYKLSKQMMSMSAHKEREEELMNALAVFPPVGIQSNQGDLSVASLPEDTEPLLYESWKSFTLPKNDRSDDKPKVVIIIDDLGMSLDRTKEINDLPAPVTMAFLPYAPQLEKLTDEAKEAGHELLIHVPMEPLNSNLDAGPMEIRTNMGRADFDAAMERIFTSFDGYVGINNHMGSKLTQDKEKMGWIMEVLEEKGLFFVDSRTIHSSVASEMANVYGLHHARRDVFLDHEAGPEFVRASLEKLEQVARRKGFAIAIGHPKTDTIEVLREWLPTLEEKGLELVSVSEVVRAMDKISEGKRPDNPAAQLEHLNKPVPEPVRLQPNPVQMPVGLQSQPQ